MLEKLFRNCILSLSLDELFKILDCITLYTSMVTEEPTPRVIY